jgi:hypothetical protein
MIQGKIMNATSSITLNSLARQLETIKGQLDALASDAKIRSDEIESLTRENGVDNFGFRDVWSRCECCGISLELGSRAPPGTRNFRLCANCRHQVVFVLAKKPPPGWGLDEPH